jgi:hypothetical protein
MKTSVILAIAAFITLLCSGCGNGKSLHVNLNDNGEKQVQKPRCDLGNASYQFPDKTIGTGTGEYLNSVSYSGFCLSPENQTHYETIYDVILQGGSEVSVKLSSTDFPLDQDNLDKILEARRFQPRMQDFQFAVEKLIPVLEPMTQTSDPEKRAMLITEAEQTIRDYFVSNP